LHDASFVQKIDEGMMHRDKSVREIPASYVGLSRRRNAWGILAYSGEEGEDGRLKMEDG
jgi:hypothetical protein